MGKRHKKEEQQNIQYPEGFVLAQKKKPKSIEDERKYRVVLGYKPKKNLTSDELFEERANTLLTIFNYVACNNAYFRKLHKSKQVEGFSEKVREFLKRPIEYSLPRTRFYSIDEKLTGIDPKTGKAETEFRSEERKDKGLWKHTIKTSKNGVSKGGTVSRGEYEEYMDGATHNFSAHPEVEDCLKTKFGLESNLKKLSKIDGQSTKILYHPDGDENILLEIKFDIQEGITIDGFTWPVIEIEVEIKSSKQELTKEDKESLLQRAEDVLYQRYENYLEHVTTSKNAEGNVHLCELKEKHPEWFEDIFKSLPYDRFERVEPPKAKTP